MMIDERESRKGLSLSLKWNASALALLAAAGGAGKALADEPAAGGVTIDVQGLYALDSNQQGAAFDSAGKFNNPDTRIGPRAGYDVLGSVTYQPPGSGFSYGVAVQYGRTNTSHKTFNSAYSGTTRYGSKYQFGRNGSVTQQQEHLFVDFNVGKDVGLGVWGRGVSTIGVGLRYAQFTSKTHGRFASASHYQYSKYNRFGTRSGTFTESRKNQAIGPRIWVQQTDVLPGSMGDAGFSINWGAGVGVLFGKQKTSNTTQVTHSSLYSSDSLKSVRQARAVRKAQAFYNPFPNLVREKSVTSPDISAFFQLSWTPPRSPLSIGAGYRFEEVFNALDGGFEVHGQQDFRIQGPYVDVSFKFK